MTTVREVFAGAGLVARGSVRWGSRVSFDGPVAYVVALTSDVDDPSSVASCPIDASAIRRLLQVRPETEVDGSPASEASLTSRLSSMWLSSEPVVYVGLAGTSLAKRVGQYYRTPLGARSPHAGGWPLKTLSVLDQLVVHLSPCSDPGCAEAEMVDAFVAGVPSIVAASLYDPSATLPFANLMFPGGRKKRHGISGVKATR